MRLFSAFFIIMTSSWAFSQELGNYVYECRFENNFVTTQSIRMKDYFDTKLGQRAGKIDLLENLNVIESTPTLVYQIPFLDQQFYVQIWYAKETRVDAQMSLSDSNRTFSASYHKGSLQQNLFCTTLNK